MGYNYSDEHEKKTEGKKYFGIRIHDDLIFFAVFLLVIFLLSSCSIVTYTGSPDGTTIVSSYSLFSDTALDKFNGSITSGTTKRKVSFSGYDDNQTNALMYLNQLAESIAAGAAKGAKP